MVRLKTITGTAFTTFASRASPAIFWSPSNQNRTKLPKKLFASQTVLLFLVICLFCNKWSGMCNIRPNLLLFLPCVIIFLSSHFSLFIFFLLVWLKSYIFAGVCFGSPLSLHNASYICAVGFSLLSILTIIPWARMGSESIAHEDEGRMGYWLRGHEGERNNCFSKIQLVGQKYRE